jgi:glycosyltransferase involved in cell wall biosynthesis
MIPIAFYAPLKSPDHAVPSGDRTMARLLLAALRRAGFAPRLASDLRTLDLAGDVDRQDALRKAGEAEADRIIGAWRALPAHERPRAWFTYHCYYKAPDWTGPRAAEALGIPYIVAEGSRSARRATGPWALGHAGAEAALDRADRLLVMTPADAEDLEPALRPGQRLTMLPPFLDAAEWDATEASRGTPVRPLRLLTVAMMRPGDKLASYRLLAEALTSLPADAVWSLDVIGDGPARGEIEAAFASVAGKVRFRGAVHDTALLAAAYREADLFVWPAIGEAYGMTLLEAQACACPVLAGREKGVEAVLRDGETGLLVPRRDAWAFAAALQGLIADPSRLGPMRRAAASFVRGERDIPQAAAILRDVLTPLLAARQARALAS